MDLALAMVTFSMKDYAKARLNMQRSCGTKFKVSRAAQLRSKVRMVMDGEGFRRGRQFVGHRLTIYEELPLLIERAHIFQACLAISFQTWHLG